MRLVEDCSFHFLKSTALPLSELTSAMHFMPSISIRRKRNDDVPQSQLNTCLQFCMITCYRQVKRIPGEKRANGYNSHLSPAGAGSLLSPADAGQRLISSWREWSSDLQATQKV